MAKKASRINSMTGFGSANAKVVNGQVSIEIRGVNNRFFDFSFRSPEFLRFVEPLMRDLCQKNINRGRCEVSIRWREMEGVADATNMNNEALMRIVTLAGEIKEQHSQLTAMSVTEALNWPGVLNRQELTNEEWQKILVDIGTEALNQMTKSRREEGERLKGFVEERLNKINGHAKKAASRIPEVQKRYLARLEERLAEVRDQLDEDRVEQEMVIFANRIDIAEEIDRLESHQKAFDQALTQGGVIGRRLDFLLQEIHREVNTLASKSNDAEQTSQAVEMKVLIEQIREQVQNIE